MELTKCELTGKQKEALMVTLMYSEIFANQIRQIFKNHGFDKVSGASLKISVNPERRLTTNVITFGEWDGNAGVLTISKGDETNGTYVPTGTNTTELEKLFIENLLSGRKEKGGTAEKELPDDGLWISSRDFLDDVDCGV